MSIELHPQGVARYVDLAKNPIYYFYALQFTHGSFYRSVLGYEVIWDEEYENKLCDHLGLFLERLAERKEYYLDNIVFTKRTQLYCLPWPRGVKPNLVRPYWLYHRFTVESETRAIARVNTVDAPYHVDIQFENGDVVTVRHTNYMNLKRNLNLKSLRKNDKSQPEQSRTDATDGQRPETKSIEGTRSEIPSWDLPDNVFDLRQRLRRADSLQKRQANLPRSRLV